VTDFQKPAQLYYIPVNQPVTLSGNTRLVNLSEIQPLYLVPRTSKIQENGTVMRWLLSVNVYVYMYSQVGTTCAKTPPSTTSPTTHTVNRGTVYRPRPAGEVDVVNQVNSTAAKQW